MYFDVYTLLLKIIFEYRKYLSNHDRK